MSIIVDIPGRERLELAHLILDVNGTLTNRGVLLDGVAERIALLRDRMALELVSADTFGQLDRLARELGVAARRAADGDEKLRILDGLGRDRCAVVGNGANDAPILAAAALGIAVVGPEGISTAALQAADVACGSAVQALDLLLDERALQATLRR